MKEHMQADQEKRVNELKTEILSIVNVLRDKGLTLGFAESCTGGLLSSYFTELAGVSDIFVGAIVSYANSVKKNFLKVSEETFKNQGAVSLECARQMAVGVRDALNVSYSVAITGIAGPSGGTKEKPVGTVFIAIAGAENEVRVFEHHLSGDRKQIQTQTCCEAVKHLKELINN